LGNPQTGKVFAEIKPCVIKQLPICTIDLTSPTDVAQHDKLVSLVDNMLKLQKTCHAMKLNQDKEVYKRQIKHVDTQIDNLVYKLYGLTDKDVKIINNFAKNP
jgi:hypothetical protein